jgi:hypothetical protein
MRFKLVHECETYQVQAGDTLSSIAEAHSCIVKNLLLCNWGSEDQLIVCRALFDVVGLKDYLADYNNAVFDGNEPGRGGSGELLLPGEWTREGLSTDTVHDITVRRPKPMPAISITGLDKWFVPGTNAAGGDLSPIGYWIEGSAERADTVTMEVVASNYCSATVDDAGAITYEPITNTTPIFGGEVQRVLPETDEKGEPLTDDGPKGPLVASSPTTVWHGQSTATTGMLAPRGSDERLVNVAFSPYTVNFRLFKDKGDAEARILIDDFWPQWDDASSLDTDSLKIKWTIENCSKLRHGILRIIDCSDEVVHVAALSEAVLNEGEFTWDGSWSSSTGNGGQPQPDKMPYRVQLEMRSGSDEQNSIAIAASHTEVRVYANAESNEYSGAEAYKNPNSLVFGWASWLPDGSDADPLVPKVPDPAVEEDAWYQYQLAEAGFHPGPITGAPNDLAKTAISEFQRSVPLNTSAPFQRLDPSGTADTETTEALSRLPAGSRPFFGNAQNDRKPFPTIADAMGVLNMNFRPSDADRAPGEIIVWVDERHYYTQAADRWDWLPPTLKDGANAPMIMGNYHGPMSSTNDDHMLRDQKCLARPWLPLEVDLQLAAHDEYKEGLGSMSRAPVDEKSRRLVGPLQMAWTFEEAGENLDVISPLDDATHKPINYDETAVRSRKYVETVVTTHQAAHGGRTFGNCPEEINGQTIGGIRPSDLSTYYKAPFGTGDNTLKPWTITDDTANERLLTWIHDDVGQDETNLYPLRRGRAGVYFNPSTIGGDGYRVKAALSFDEPLEGADFPNRKVLKRRYSVLPKAHTANLRIWRKASFRAVLAWLPSAMRADDANLRWLKDRYARAFVHAMVDPGESEIITGITELEMSTSGGAPSTWSTADSLLTEAEFQSVVQKGLRGSPYSGYPVTLHPTTMWPFTSMPALGFTAKTGLIRDTPDSSGNHSFRVQTDMERKISTRAHAVLDGYMRDLAIFLLKNIEERKGLMKGLTTVYAMYTPAVTYQEYICSNAGCNVTFAEIVGIRGSTTAHSAGTACPRHNDDNGNRCQNGTWQTLRGEVYYGKGVNHYSVGLALGVSLINATHNRNIWPHEIGHNKHLQHGRSCTWGDEPGGFTDSQHDVAVNTPHAAKYASDAAKDQRWDRICIMGYTNGDTVEQFFCGKCILKNRGWAIEPIDDPAGTICD